MAEVTTTETKFTQGGGGGQTLSCDNLLASHLAKYTPQSLVDSYFALMTYGKREEMGLSVLV